MRQGESYKGIDYSLGQSNFDRETGIHFGVISQHSILIEAMSDFEQDYGKPTCPECGNPVKESAEVENADKDYHCTDCMESYWSDVCFSDESLGFSYDSDGYRLMDCLDSDIFVLKSPYYTFAQFCSPCVPGAGNLETFVTGGVKTYALGHDWFEDGKAPYPVYDVKTGLLVETEEN